MKWKGTLRAPRVDLSDYRRRLSQHMANVLAQSLMVWLEAVLAEIPVWSGASHATFLPLARDINYLFPIDPIVTSRIAEGERRGSGKVETNEAKGQYVFTYSTTLPWLLWNEYHNANVDPDPTLMYRVIKEGPYNFQGAGASAFRQFASSVDLPSVRPSIKPVVFKVA